jgi:hypothetical protein
MAVRPVDVRRLAKPRRSVAGKVNHVDIAAQTLSAEQTGHPATASTGGQSTHTI